MEFFAKNVKKIVLERNGINDAENAAILEKM